MNVFNKKPNPKEALRDSKRGMQNATRGYKAENVFESYAVVFSGFHHDPGLEKEIGALQQEEKKLVVEIKRTAKSGNEAATKILARQLIRLRQQIANLQGSRAQMRGIATHTQAMHAQSSVAVGLKGANKAMETMNKQMAPAKQMKVIREFQKQSAQMDMTTEMMSDAIDDAIDSDEAEEETDELTNQVLDEIGVDVSSQLSAAPKGKIAGKNREGASSSGVDELEKRLAALRNP
ncbi:hypothetical protein SADUNF_Sadunf02G0030000 [Salix dunnii]|uniref:SNF7 family protein n=1 Tax=Salix dunnii TaxID=1413687 RepID=A0A835N5U7_9ROSI|nr:hypothetical protein SADUNF_Sadunf02G0030000 [Salix dunnii]